MTAHRLLARSDLRPGTAVLDFGCGDGAFARQLAGEGFLVHGTDIAPTMVELASEQTPADIPANFSVGTAADIAEHDQVDALVCLNVLAYLTDDESAEFWMGARRAVRPGGWLLVSHSNELFDLFALNSGTAAFFARHLTSGQDISALLTTADQQNPSYNVRANPLTYAADMEAWGFTETAQAFFNFHPLPPSLLGPGDNGRLFDPDRIDVIERWKQMLQCSTYFSLAQATSAPAHSLAGQPG